MGRISDSIDAYVNKSGSRYHTPGHKGRLNERDLTEIGDFGSIFPANSVSQAEADCAAIYGVPYLRFLVNGSSIGIKAALYPFKGRKVLYAAGAHVSFFNGCSLFNVNAACIGSGGDGAVYTCGCRYLPPPPTADEVRQAIRGNPDAEAVFITSPDCLGRCADIKIADVCREHNIALIADSAHGAHFAFADGLNKFRFDRVADICNMSAHKTLGSYTQTALLAVNNDARRADADRALDLLGTTSPNYVLYESIENAVVYAERHRSDYARLFGYSQQMRRLFRVLNNEDYTRLCIKPSGGAREAYDLLARKGVYCEAVLNGYLVFILTPYDSPEKLEELKNILAESL